MTFLEVVFATVVLAMAVATFASVVTTIHNAQVREQHSLACAELANRLIIQRISDETKLPNDILPIPYGRHQYRFKLSVERVRSRLDPAAEAKLAEAGARDGGITPDRLLKITARVWLSEHSGGSFDPRGGAPQASLVRLVDPMALHRRPPDSLNNLVNSQNGLQKLLERILTPGQGVEE